MNKNPIFTEWSSHENAMCYKICNPWTAFAEEKLVLCPYSEGMDKAIGLAQSVLAEELADAFKQPLQP